MRSQHDLLMLLSSYIPRYHAVDYLDLQLPIRCFTIQSYPHISSRGRVMLYELELEQSALNNEPFPLHPNLPHDLEGSSFRVPKFLRFILKHNPA